MINDEHKMNFYLARIKDKYIRFHKVIEHNGLFGIVDHENKTIISPKYEFLRTCYTYVDDLVTMPVIAQKNGKLGLILPDRKDTVVADFIFDDIQLRDEYPYFEGWIGDKKVYLDDSYYKQTVEKN